MGNNSGTFKHSNSLPSAVVIPSSLNNSELQLNDFKLLPLELPASYTSLKDMITSSNNNNCNSSPSSMLSPTPPPNSILSSPSLGSGYEISIRNRLVKQAAWAYLQPTTLQSSPSSSSSSSSSCCNCLSREIVRPVFDRVKGFLCETVVRVYDWLVDVLWFVLCR